MEKAIHGKKHSVERNDMAKEKRHSIDNDAGKRLLAVCLVFFVLLTAVFLLILLTGDRNREETIARSQLVLLNRLEENPEVLAELRDLTNELLKQSQAGGDFSYIVVIYIVSVGFLLIVTAYLYITVIHPFRKLERYAGEIAGGNLDVELGVERGNYFGKFTWAFDHLRKEIRKARSLEREAIENNKTVIATLSHDIKTPLASIRAYCEALEACIGDVNRRGQYLSVIMRKCDEVTALTNDLFLHALMDLNMLAVTSQEIEISSFLREVIGDLNAEGKICFPETLPEAMVCSDKKRLAQAVENIISNAVKYACTEIEIRGRKGSSGYELYFRDYGPGIPDEDIPFVMGKFYRGKNAVGKQGSGLGLYIVNYIMEQTGGELRLRNRDKGLEVMMCLSCQEVIP